MSERERVLWAKLGEIIAKHGLTAASVSSAVSFYWNDPAHQANSTKEGIDALRRELYEFWKQAN